MAVLFVTTHHRNQQELLFPFLRGSMLSAGRVLIAIASSLSCLTLTVDHSFANPALFSTGSFYEQATDRQQDAIDVSIETLISQLGDSRHIVRNEAEAKLQKIGGPAIELLRSATTHRDENKPDSEIRLRATRLLILIERKERERKIAEFLEGNFEALDLDGWPEFSKITGSDRIARKLFVDMHQAQPDLLTSIKIGKKTVDEAYQNVSRRSLRSNAYSNATQSVGTLTALLFVSTLEFKTEPGQRPAKVTVSEADLKRLQTALTQTQMITFVNSSGNTTQVGRLISSWLETLPDDENAAVHTQLAVIEAYQLHDQLTTVTKFATDRNLPPPTRTKAIDSFGALATQKDVSKLSPLLNDETVVGNYLPRANHENNDPNQGEPNFEKHPNRPLLMQVQIRDLALATSLKLSKLDVSDFGFDRRCFSKGKLARNFAGFFSDEDRNAAFEKWAQRASLD